jgi:ABC-type multidrug transport system fused ATPase/permease subunit
MQINDAQQQWAVYFYTVHLPALASQKISLYEWQIIANNIMLGVVSILTLSGVILAGIQLYWSRKILDKISAGGLGYEEKKLHVSSPFVGLLILVVSFSFFFVYVRDVYTIKTNLNQIDSDINSSSELQNVLSPGPPLQPSD